ncbi:EI24 domain-containing protein [Pelomonas sp. SE-A7]|uniref:EI24 domain-containing protein n=1 Tax=Pelomonas sp. SE-A7 TaxID=3054953 RepID=UPI00259CFDBF|nr:EI24 domain-containing protein [Pelomonas sp. SE-A7]MDM4766081.1 EI24 domain-containing protein [Pelomonas sp. SE-A7]
MSRLGDSFWRAVAYCLHPKVIGLSLLPLLLVVLFSGGFMYFFWEASVDGMRSTIEHWALVETLLRWLDALGANGFRSALAPLLVLALVLPVIVVLSLVMVAVCMTQAIVKLVAERRFPQLERKQGGKLWQGLAITAGATLLALGALLFSLPFWLIPPLALILPPLIWGWLSYKVFSFDVLAEHASVDERRTLLREHKMPLLAIGVITGYLGAAPALIWAAGMMAVVLAPLLIVATVWLYMLVFAFSTAWFAHYALAALQASRAAAMPPPSPVELQPLVPLA